MAASYEEQIKKWASVRYKVSVDEIEQVRIDSENWVTEGCPTCGPMEDEYFDVYVYCVGWEKKRELLINEEIRDLAFEDLLQQIVEA